MVKTGISEVIPFLLDPILEILSIGYYLFIKRTKVHRLYTSMQHPIFEKTVIDKLIEAFDNIYPRMTFELKTVDIRPMFGEVLRGNLLQLKDIGRTEQLSMKY